MRRLPLALGLTLTVAVTVAVGTDAASAAPPKGEISGQYRFTFTVTNADLMPGKLIVRVLEPCREPCTSFRTEEHALGSVQDRGDLPRVWKWNGKRFVFHQRLPFAGRCVGTKMRENSTGYDIVSTFKIKPIKVEDGHVVRFTGTGKDDYVVNDRGRKIGCVPGAYDYDIKAVVEP